MPKLKREDDIEKLEEALIEARKEYNRLLEMERQADPELVDYYVYRIKAQEKILGLLKQKVMERVG